MSDRDNGRRSNSFDEQDKNDNECKTDSLPTTLVISNPNHDLQASIQAQHYFNNSQPPPLDRYKSQSPELDDPHTLLEISKEESDLQFLLDDLRLEDSLKVKTNTNTANDEAHDIVDENIARATLTTSSISTPEGIETVELLTTTTTTQRITLRPHIVATSSQNRIDNYKYFLRNEIFEKLGKSYNFFKGHVEVCREKDELKNLKNFITSLDNFILGGNNQNQQDFSIANCQSALTFCKNKLKVVKSATLRIQLENLKTNLFYIKIVFQFTG
ncbi:hypothetical protein ACTFIW_010905 [Dictyostelium discoideum]